MKTLSLLFVLVSSVAAQADLKSWLHGTPPSATPGKPDAKAATVSFAGGVNPDKQILEFMQAFAEAMRIHDGSSLRSRLSEKYAIEDLPEEHNAVDFFMQAMIKIRAPDDIIISSIDREGDLRIAKLEFRSVERGTKTRTFKFDSAGKLLSANFFTLKRH
jgi:hypothetical protein